MKITTKILFLLAIAGLFAFASCDNQPTGETVDVTDIDENATNNTPVAATMVAYPVNTEASVVNWEGAKVTGKHNGTLKVKEGNLQVEGDQIKGGTFVLDMNSIVVTDLQPNQGKEKLEGHLKTGDFFEVEKFPTAKFEITQVAPADDRNDATHYITGNLTIRDVTKQVKLPATVSMSGNSIMAETPAFVIDRQLWGIDYEGQSDNLIKNDIGLVIKLQASRADS